MARRKEKETEEQKRARFERGIALEEKAERLAKLLGMSERTDGRMVLDIDSCERLLVPERYIDTIIAALEAKKE